MVQIFKKNGHKIIWGDALEVVSKEIQDNSIDLIFADPPYNIGKDFNGRKDKCLAADSIFFDERT